MDGFPGLGWEILKRWVRYYVEGEPQEAMNCGGIS